MRQTLLAALLLAAAALPAGAVPPRAAVPPMGAAVVAVSDAEDAVAVVRSVYDAYNDGNYDDQDKRTFTPELYKLYMDVQNGAGDDIEYAVDFDVFLNAQDFDTVKVNKADFTPTGKDKGTVKVNYTAFDDTQDITFLMVKRTDGWKIDDIDWGSDQQPFRAMLEDLLAEQKKAGAN